MKLNPDRRIVFDSNFSQVQTQTLVVENISQGNVAFKVKTTSLKSYLVRPSNAVIRPGETKEVSIHLQKLSKKPKPEEHRFLVQALATTLSEISSKDAWAEMQKSGTVHEFRLSVDFTDTNDVQLTSSSYDGSTELMTKYEELAKYTEKLENQKKVFEENIRELQAQSAGPKKKGYQLWQIVAAVILALFLAKVFDRVRQGKK